MTYNGRGTDNTRELGQELRDKRHQRGLSQVKLAVILGVSSAALSRWENGTRNPKLMHSQRISCWLQQVGQN